jgi:type I restriction enzyme M protein
LKREDPDDFVKCYSPKNRFLRQPTWCDEKHPLPGSPPQAGEGAHSEDFGEKERSWAYGYEELISRDKASLDIFWLKDESPSDSDNLPTSEVIAAEIVEDLEAALEQFRELALDLGGIKAEEIA